MPGGVETALRDLVAATSNLNQTLDKRFGSFDERLGKIAESMNGRLDETDRKIGEVGGHVANIEARVGNVDQRLTVLEAGPSHPQGRPAATRAASPVAAPPVAAPHVHARMAAARPSAGHLHGFALRGVARGDAPETAWVETPGGFFLVTKGQTLNGAGTVREIRRAGSSWEVITSEGVIRP